MRRTIARRQTWYAEESRAWLRLAVEAGSCTVVVAGFDYALARELLIDYLRNVPVISDQPRGDLETLVERIVHVGPQRVVEGCSRAAAQHLKQSFEHLGVLAIVQ